MTTYLVCWNHDCRQTYPASDYKATDLGVNCPKCGGTLISLSGRVQISGVKKPLTTVDPAKLIETEECQECGGSGFSSPGTGYNSVCDTCGGQGQLPI